MTEGASSSFHTDLTSWRSAERKGDSIQLIERQFLRHEPQLLPYPIAVLRIGNSRG